MKGKILEAIIRNIIEKYEPQETEEVLDKIKELGFEYSTWSGVSWGMDDLIVPPEKGAIVARAEKEIEVVDDHFRKGLLSGKKKVQR